MTILLTHQLYAFQQSVSWTYTHEPRSMAIQVSLSNVGILFENPALVNRIATAEITRVVDSGRIINFNTFVADVLVNSTTEVDVFVFGEPLLDAVAGLVGIEGGVV